jgi:predicted phosphodiesterase
MNIKKNGVVLGLRAVSRAVALLLFSATIAAQPKEQFADIFGNTRSRPAPRATLDHLPSVEERFIAITDVHVGPQGMENWAVHNWRVEEAVRQINALQPDFTIHLGDSVTTNTSWPEEQYMAFVMNGLDVLGRLKCRLYQVPGTHDVGWAYMDHYSKPHPFGTGNLLTPASCQRYRKYFGDDHYSFETKTSRFIVINDQLCNSGYPEDLAQMKWLEETLARPIKDKHTFLLMHDPLFMRTPSDPLLMQALDKNTSPKEPINAISRNADKLDVIYTGHVHRDYAHWYKGIYVHGLNSTTWNFPWLTFAGTQRPISKLAQFYDPYKLGYLVIRMKGGDFHESWVPLYWQMSDPPKELASLCGPRVIGRPASEVEDSVLGLAAVPPALPGPRAPSSFWDGGLDDNLNIVCDQWWRLGENIGSKWLQVYQGPKQTDYWGDLQRGLTLSRPRGIKMAVPLHADRTGMEADWQVMRPYSEAISAVVICNGKFSLVPPADGNLRLTSWAVHGTPAEWAESCVRARGLAPKSTKIVLGRMPLLGKDNLSQIRKTAEALNGKADALIVWLATQEVPEKVAGAIASAAQIAQACNLELWLDGACWEKLKDPLRSAYFLRLLALCQAYKVRLFWWNGPEDEAGLLDGFWDPTQLYFAAQAWQSVVSEPVGPVQIELGELVSIKWKDRAGRNYETKWLPSDKVEVRINGASAAPISHFLCIDPLHARILQLSPSGALPLCSWPIVVRSNTPKIE